MAGQRCTCRVHFPGRFHTSEAVGTALARCTQCSLCRPLGNDTPQKTDPLPQTLLGRPRLCAPRWPVTSVWESIDKEYREIRHWILISPVTNESHQDEIALDFSPFSISFRDYRTLRFSWGHRDYCQFFSFFFFSAMKINLETKETRNFTIELIVHFYRIFFELLLRYVIYGYEFFLRDNIEIRCERCLLVRKQRQER